ncbi:hypothetical protein B0J14DRAFT_693736 [Halenospora varia]|nr:hypothetical protein B0J14DRAFT_693736 [Halenospora varia]
MSLQNRPKGEVRDWILVFHKTCDTLKTDKLHEFYTKNSTLQFANNPELHGLDAIIANFDRIFPLLSSMKHEISSFGNPPHALPLSYFSPSILTPAGDAKKEEFRLHTVGIFTIAYDEETGLGVGVEKDGRRKGVMERLEVYVDLSPVLERIAEVGVGR